MTLQPSFPIATIALVTAVLVLLALAAIVLRRGPWWSWALRILAVLLLAVVALRPALPSAVEPGPTAKGSLEVYFAIDTTSSVVAEDWDGDKTRLEGIKTDVTAIVEALAGAQFSLVTFDSSSVQRVPLTSDASAVESAASVLTQEVTQYSHGSSVDEAVPLLSTLLEQSATSRPDDRRVLFYLGDGEQTSSEAPGSFDGLARYLDGGAVLGYGTAAGGRMLDFDGFGDANSNPQYIRDFSVSPPADALSHIDEKQLSSIAHELGVPYLHRERPGGIDEVVSGMDPGSPQVEASVPDPPVELYWWFAIPLGLILVVELARAIGRLTRTLRSAT